MTCGICGELHIDPSKVCYVCGGAHDGDWHQRLGCMGVFAHLRHSVPGLPLEALDDPLLAD
jgi:hypothetical protein